jgi:hypothetical protein
MEADADFAREARRRGLKLSRLTAVTKLPWTPYEDPDGFWWLIDDTGCKVLFDMPDQGLLVEGEAA